MAIPHLRAQIIGAGKSAVRYAAYRHRTKMFDELEGSNTHRYDKEKDLVYSEFSIPDNSPLWISGSIRNMKSNAEKSEWLWNYVQNNERTNGQLSREIVIALPCELSKEQNINLVREFIESNLTKRGLISDWVYHDKIGNPHVHLMHTLRPVSEKGFGKKKISVLNEDGTVKRNIFNIIGKDGVIRQEERIVYENVIGYKDAMKSLRISWGEIASKHLAMAGHDIKIDMRSFEERGISVEPTIHLGQSASAMKMKGGKSNVVLASETQKKISVEKIKNNPDEILRIISCEKSTFSRKDIAKTLNRYIDDPQIFNSIFVRIEKSENLIKLQDNEKLNSIIYSTSDIVKTEYDMVRNADFLSKTKGHALRYGVVEKTISEIENKNSDKQFKFAKEQVAAIQHITADNGIAVIVGYAGAGKSTLLEAANFAWEKNRKRVLGAALSGKAAEGLEQSSGIKSRTLSSWEYAWNNGKDTLLPGDVFVIDEAGMISSRQLSIFIEKIKNVGAKAILVGDPMQLQPIEAGAAFRAVIEQVGHFELSEIRRQKAEWARDASINFARGEVKKALDDYRSYGFIHETKTHDEAIEQVVCNWLNSYRNILQKHGSQGKLPKGDEIIVLAHTNSAVTRLNANMRHALKEEGLLSPEDIKYAVHYETQKGKREFVVNDRVIFLENARFKENTTPELGQQEVKNGMLGTVIATRDKQDREILKVRLDCGRDVVFSNQTYQNIDYGYAVTIHKSQGITVDNSFVLASPSMDQHLAYVAMSRHRDNVHLYAAYEDFKNVPMREHRRIDSVLVGELVDTGCVKFNENAITQTPYADIKTSSGIERVYGVNLPFAIDGADIQLGDIIELRQAKEVVFAGKYKKNIFDITVKERGIPSLSQEIGKQEKVGTYDRLVKAFSRTGAKSVTMDYAQSPDYRDYIASFTHNHGIDTKQGLGEKIVSNIALSREWVRTQREKLAILWDRAKVAFVDIQRKASVQRIEDVEVRKNTLSAGNQVYLAAFIEHKISPEEVVRNRVRKEKSYINIFDELVRNLQKIYKDPKSASIRIEKTILAGEGEKLPDILMKSPQKAGELQGSGRMIDKLRASGRERLAALDNVPVLVSTIRELQSFYKNSYELHVSSEINRRERMRYTIPALSKDAKHFMRDVAVGYASYVNMPAAIEREILQINDAFNRRFGYDAVHKSDFNMMQSIPPEQSASKEQIKELQQAIKFVREYRQFEIRQLVQTRHLDRGVKR